MELNFQAADLVLLKPPDMDGGLRWSPGGPFVAHSVISRLGPAVEDQWTSLERLYQASRQSKVPATPWCSNQFFTTLYLITPLFHTHCFPTALKAVAFVFPWGLDPAEGSIV